MYSISSKITLGDKDRAELDMVLTGLERRMENFKSLWMLIRPVLAKSMARNFASESAISGKWPELEPETLKYKRKHGYPDDILVRTGELIMACTDIGETAGPNQIMIDTEKRFAFGVTLDYSWYHDRPGGAYGKRREHLALDAEGESEIYHVVAFWIREVVNQIGVRSIGPGSQKDFY